MYFYKEDGKQHLDLTGDFILTHNDQLVKARVKSAGPTSVKNVKYIHIKKLSFMQKVKASIAVIGFMWDRDESLKQENTNCRESHRANVVNLHTGKK